MTRIAHLANAMPTRLELVKGEIEETEHAPAAMLNLNETNGGYGDVSFGKMNKPGVQRAVAIKTFVANVVVKVSIALFVTATPHHLTRVTRKRTSKFWPAGPCLIPTSCRRSALRMLFETEGCL